MTCLTFVTVSCDGHCAEYVDTPESTRHAAREWVAQDGWTRTVTNLDLCPSCNEKWGDA